MANLADITRFTLSNENILDNAGNIDRGALKDWTAQINYLKRAMESATGEAIKMASKVDEITGKAQVFLETETKKAQNAREALISAGVQLEQMYSYSPDLVTSMTEDVMKELTYLPTIKGKKAQKLASIAMERIGGEAVSDPTHVNKDRMRVTYTVTDAEYQNRVAYYKGDESKANEYFNRKLRGVLGKSFEASKFESEEREAKEAEEAKKREEVNRRKEERESKANLHKIVRAFTVVTATLTVIADIARRILTVTLAKASETKAQALSAFSVGITQEALRTYASQERAMGMREGIFASALQSIQANLGDISNLNTKTLEELGKVLGGDVLEAIKVGLGQSNPEKVMQVILDTFYKRGQLGINSIGQEVGRAQAERQLATALENAGLNDLAEVLRNMFYANDTGIYKGMISTANPFADFMSLVTHYTMGFSEVDNRHVSELGQVIDELRNRFTLLKDNLEKGLLLSLEGVINRINNFKVGKSATELYADNRRNIELNENAINKMRGLQDTSKQEVLNILGKAGISGVSALGYGDIDSFLGAVASGAYFKKTAIPSTQFDARLRLERFLQTDEGVELIKELSVYEVAKNLEEVAKKDLEKGRKTGATPYQPTLFTDSSVQGLTSNLENYTYREGSVALLSQVRGGKNLSAEQAIAETMLALYPSNRALYDEYIKLYNKGNPLTYDYALAQGDSDKLTEHLYSMFESTYKNKSWFKKLKKNYKSKEGILKGLTISEDVPAEVKEAFATAVENSLIAQMGTTQSGWGLITTNFIGIMTEKLEARFRAKAGSDLIFSEAERRASDFFTRAGSNRVTATISEYDKKTGNVTVTLVSKDAKSNEMTELVKFTTDAILEQGDWNVTRELGNNTAKAQENNSTL